MFPLLICFVCLSFRPVFINSLKFQTHPDTGLNINQLLTKYGYPVETHNVVTEDDYIITIFRIPHGKNSSKVHKYPVVLVPGTCGCSENFIATGPDNALGFYLANKGFDVWLANTRGNRHARKHKNLKPDDKHFWNFGWHEVAVYDTPAIIDHVLGVTKASQVFYVGHSQGTTSFFAFATEKPEYNQKIRLSIQMAPSVFLKETRSVVYVLGKHSNLIQNVMTMLDLHTLFPKRINDFVNFLLRVLCSEMTFFVDICYLIIYFTAYSHNNLIDPMHLQLALQTSPAGCSVKELIHYFQLVYSGVFKQFDYGKKKNLKYYGVEIPPLYNLSKITSPISLFSSASDNLVPYQGVQELGRVLPNVESLYNVPNKYFNHVDFIFSNVTGELVNKPIYDLFIKYLNKDNV